MDLENINGALREIADKLNSNPTQKYRWSLLANIALILLVLGLFGFMVKMYFGNKEDMSRMDLNFAALNDSVTKVKERGDSTYTFMQSMPVYEGVGDLMNSEFFKTLSKDQQAYYKEISKVKGLMTAMQLDLEIVKAKVLKIPIDPKDIENGDVVITDTTITFNRGYVLSVDDSTSTLKSEVEITMDNPLQVSFKHTFKPVMDIQVVERKKNGDVVVKVKFNDPDISVTEEKLFTVPYQKEDCNFMCKMGKVAKGVGIFVGGVLVGIVIMAVG